MIFSYAHVSTNSQTLDRNSLEAQIKSLKEAGAEKIFSDIFSSSKNNRPRQTSENPSVRRRSDYH